VEPGNAAEFDTRENKDGSPGGELGVASDLDFAGSGSGFLRDTFLEAPEFMCLSGD
jgi:hypothetical protein